MKNTGCFDDKEQPANPREFTPLGEGPHCKMRRLHLEFCFIYVDRLTCCLFCYSYALSKPVEPIREYIILAPAVMLSTHKFHPHHDLGSVWASD